MTTLLMLTIIGVILIALGLTGMYLNTLSRLSAIEDEIKAHEAEITSHKRDIRVIKDREALKSDRIVIAHADDISYPNTEGL